MEEVVKVTFSCHECGILHAEVYVLARKEEDDIIYWMDNTLIPTLSEAHRQLSPNCKARKMDEVKIPINNEIIGGKQ